MWLNEEGKLIDLPLNVALTGDDVFNVLDIIQGNVFFAGHDGEGGTIGLTDAQITWIINHFNNANYLVVSKEGTDEVFIIPTWVYNPSATL